MRYPNCHAIFSGLASSFIATGRNRSRRIRATGPAALSVLVRAAFAMTLSTRARRSDS